jgi:SNF2 family DNA or RNA helicase
MSFTGTLLPYQPEAVDKMCERGSMLVAYDLGLGKTVLTIAAIEQMMDEKGILEPGLIICLSSLKYQWASQIEKFTNGSVPLVIDGTPSKRAEQYQTAIDWKETGVDYVILNYEQVVNDWEYIKYLPKGFIVLDEATAIKSFKSKRSKQIKKLSSPIRFALTGTPIENGRPEELFSIMQFVDSSVLGRFDQFDKTFILRGWNGWVDGYKNLDKFHELMKQASVRKSQTDPDVSPYLPKTIHRAPVLVSFDRASAKLYKAISSEVVQDIKNAMENFGSSFSLAEHYGDSSSSKRYSDMDEARGQIMSKVGCLRMLCSHPDLLKLSADKFKTLQGGSAYAHFLAEEGLLDNLKSCPKLDFLVSYVKDFLATSEQNKLVIFASYIGMVDMIADSLGRDICVTYTGAMDAKTKELTKENFNNNPAVRVFVSSDAGGYGVDLPSANLLINYDLPWSAGTAAQRNGRIRRASSKWPVIVIQDILMGGSIEQRQYEVLQQKSSVASAIIDGSGFDEHGSLTINIDSLTKFLEGEST